MIPYVLHVALLLSVCVLFYKILLQKETFYRLNRVVLVACLALSFALPLISIPQQWALRDNETLFKTNITTVNEYHPVVNQLEDKETTNGEVVNNSGSKKITFNANSSTSLTTTVTKSTARVTPPVVNNMVSLSLKSTTLFQQSLKWLFYIYWTGVAAFALNLLLQVIVLLYQAYTKPAMKDGKYRIVELSGDKAPCSFGNNIFINPEKYDWETYSQILLHEKIHIQQGHTFDILMAELVLVLQWFNPFAWLYRSEVENNLEFLTDDAVLGHKDIERSSYQMSLLKVSAPHLSLGITTNYNQSLLKRRIVMMNAKKSNIHIMWKYFFLLPLLGVLASALNDPAAYSEAAKPVAKNNYHKMQRYKTATEGSWFATIKAGKVKIEFKSDSDDHNWSSNSDFSISEFSSLPTEKKEDFTLTREAGTILFNGKFDNGQGYGHYKYTASKAYKSFLGEHGITELEDGDDFAFFMLNIKKEYVLMLENNGYKNISKNELISMSALKVDEPYIHFWKTAGYGHLTPDQLVSGKAMGITGAYISEIHKAGYAHLSFDQLISFKATGITGKYITGLHGINPKPGKNAQAQPVNMPAEDVISVKALNVSPDYINALQNEGYTNISLNELTSMKAVGVTPEYIEGLKTAGYRNIKPNDLVSLKSLGVTPGYLTSLSNIGYKNIPANELSSMKAVGVTPEFVAGFRAAGYKNIPVNDLVSLRAIGITPEYAKSFESSGFKNIPVSDLSAIKALGITHEYIQSFRDIGYKDISVSTVSSLKALGITADFIEGFRKIGYDNITLEEATSLKATGVTPDYVTEKRSKGFKSQDLNKYIEMKNAFN